MRKSLEGHRAIQEQAKKVLWCQDGSWMLENSRGKTLTRKDIKLGKRKPGSQKTNPATLMISPLQAEMEASPSCLSAFTRSGKSQMGSTDRTNSFLILLCCLHSACSVSYLSKGHLNKTFPQREGYNLYTAQMPTSIALKVLPMS